MFRLFLGYDWSYLMLEDAGCPPLGHAWLGAHVGRVVGTYTWRF